MLSVLRFNEINYLKNFLYKKYFFKFTNMTLNQNRNKFFQCTASGICAKWNDLLDQLIAAVDGASYGGGTSVNFR